MVSFFFNFFLKWGVWNTLCPYEVVGLTLQKSSAEISDAQGANYAVTEAKWLKF